MTFARCQLDTVHVSRRVNLSFGTIHTYTTKLAVKNTEPLPYEECTIHTHEEQEIKPLNKTLCRHIIVGEDCDETAITHVQS